MRPVSVVATFTYTRWKALLFGGLLSSLAAAMAWVGVEAIDPAWTASVTKGQHLVDAPVWVRAPVILTVAALCALSGIWQVGAGLLRLPIVRIDEQGIEARTSFGGRRRLAWNEIVGLKRKQNQLVLSPAGIDTIGQEIWDRKSVTVPVGMLDADMERLEELVRRFRPDLIDP